jgi:hypothetical protein
LPSTTYETQDVTTAEVLEENVTARADASTATPRDRIDDRLREIAENLYGIDERLYEIAENLSDVKIIGLEQSEFVDEWTRLIREKVGRKRNPNS